ncbi:MAG: acetylglutamate kinase [Gammaproteobacteria bacterium HGW-Gammaproteobacteria-2]|jgi:acetylglutamate kinase|nr:MAG: acetylglutamate kinase [Gammaproteobacteria bacterium HGW-Gammaproteobacteria-2]
MNDLRPTIVRLLSNMASAKEIQQYLKRFSQLDAARFAVVKVGGAILRDELDSLVSSLAFLQQVGLTPVVIHGAGPQLDVDMGKAGIEKHTVDGLRVTSGEGLAVVRRVLQRENLRLVEALQAAGVRATSLQTGVFECAFLGRRKYGLVGKVTQVHTEGIHAALKVRSIPVIASLGETASGQILNVNADWAANDLVKNLQPYKIVFLTGTGGLLDGEERMIDSINLSTEYDDLMAQPWLHSGMRVKITQIHDLLMALPPSSSVSITRPDELAKELFTHRGSGTLVRRGEKIRRYSSWKRLDLARLGKLIESGFGRKLAPDYFERTKPWRIYVSEHYRAAMVLTRENGITHLDKFAVSDDAQGEGLGRAAWLVMKAENPQMFWRARPGNAINDFYASESDGCLKGDKWNVYWYGLHEFDDVRFAIDHCRNRPATLKG